MKITKTFDIAQTDGWIVASTPTLDRDRDRIMPMGGDLTSFEKNPILIFGHNYQEPWAVIGRVSGITVDTSGIRMKPELREPANEADPMHIVRALWNHNSDLVLGSTKAGTLTLSEDSKGLRFELNPPDTSAGRDAVVSIKRGDVDGMSFGFRVLKQEWDEKHAKNIVRTLVEVDLHEVSATAFPAYPDTKVKVRTIADDYEDERAQRAEEIEKNQLIIDSLKRRTRIHELE
jgi:HK97 family phage prohead protease